MGGFRLTRTYHFSAGHRLENAELPDEENARIYGQCHRQHGHNYLLVVSVQGEAESATGMAVDLGQVDSVVQEKVLSRVDHYDLSSAVPELDGVITTGEGLARAFWEWLAPALPPGSLRRVAVVETANNVFEYCGEDCEVSGDDGRQRK
jgi:6-pyruvoyltetrahydropterin/6-carboxytetrahydropterin synthase